MNSEKMAQLEKFFGNAIKLALQDQMSWSILTSLVDDMTSTLDQCKQLIKILLKELQIIHKQKKVKKMPQLTPEIVYTEKEEVVNDDVKINEHIFEDRNDDSESEIQEMRDEMFPESGGGDEIENNKVIANADSHLIEELEYQKVDNEEETQPAEPYNLKDFYTFVGNTDNKNVGTQDRTSGPEIMKNERKLRDQSFKIIGNAEGFDVKDDQSKLTLMDYKEKELECSICLKSFSSKKSLKIHGKIHSGEKPFKCKMCKKSFSHSQDLKRHERIHTRDKPFKCKTCKETFRRLMALKFHETIHAE